MRQRAAIMILSGGLLGLIGWGSWLVLKATHGWGRA